jgi:hypothetical protein
MNRQQQIAAVTAALLRLEGWIPANHRIKSKAEVADEHAFIIEMAMSAIEGKSRIEPDAVACLAGAFDYARCQDGAARDCFRSQASVVCPIVGATPPDAFSC